MHPLATQFINANGISAIALAFFTALFGAVSAVFIQNIQTKAKLAEAKDVALETKAEAEKAKKNTEHTANGFASEVDRKLTHIINEQEKLSGSFQKHLEWHIENPQRKGIL